MRNNGIRKVFFTSDWHVGHAKSIEFDKRPFKDVDHMHRVLINNYNATVPEDGICYFLGDIGISKHETVKKVVNELNGTKVCILGNHDGGVNSLYRAGFDVVMYGGRLIIDSQEVTMTHCPLLGLYREDISGMKGAQENENWHGENREKHRRFTIPDRGQFHLHGHIHSPNDGRSKKILDKQYDVGVVANDYRPVSISVIESWIAKYAQRTL